MAEGNYDWQGPLFVALALIIAACFLLPRMSQLDTWSSLTRILTVGLVLRVVFSISVIWIYSYLYGDLLDAAVYHSRGILVSQHIWQSEFDQVVPYLQWGTQFIYFFTGIIYSIIGPTLYGGFLVYAIIAFLGSYFFYMAFRVAFPQGNRQLYAILVFFFPSILFWSNGIGKDALIFLCIGLFAYGCAQLTRNQFQGFLPLALGLLGVIYIRPHIAMILSLPLVLVFLARGVGRGATGAVISVIGLLAVGGFAWFLLPQFMVYVNINELSFGGVTSGLQHIQSLSFIGGSAFQNVDISNPLNFPLAVVTILFRPFPWEANNLLAIAQSFEGVIFIGLVLWQVKSLGKAIASSLSNAYILFILIYIIAFIIAFTAIQNFGWLARQRTMMLPFFFMLMAYTPSHARIQDKAQELAI